MKAQLILENGKRFAGEMFGAEKNVAGEVVFTTGMIGYQETVTDAAYAGQIVTMTFPVIGNYGVNFDNKNTDEMNATAIIVREKCEKPSNFRSEMTFSSFLKQQNIVGLCGIDTRALTKILRDEGAMRGVIITGEPSDDEIKGLFAGIDDADLILKASTKEEYTINPDGQRHAALIDMGASSETVAALKGLEFKISVMRADATAKNILEKNPDIVVISNGPGNPQNAPGTAENIKELLGELPVLGVGMGCQLLAIAMGGTTEKMKFGHHGANQPVKDLISGKVNITSQSHIYVVSRIPDGAVEIYKNVNDESCEGFENKKLKALGVQFGHGSELEKLIDRIWGGKN